MMKFLFRLICFQILLLGSVSAQVKFPKKIIQFGWDYPTITFIKENIKSMEEKPFDGVAYSFDFRIYDLFDTTIYPIEKFQFDDLKQINWGSLTDNFIRLRAQSLNGPNWTNDRAWEKVLVNIRNISKAIQVSKAKGIFFDPEYYYHNLPDKNTWIYDKRLFPGLTYEEVGNIVKKRGKDFIQALQYYKTDPDIVAFYLMSLVTLQKRQKPISQTGMALYPFFVEGMMIGKNPETSIIDGNELGFSYQSERQFVFSGKEIVDWGIDMMPDGLKAVYSKTTVSQPIFYDLIYGTFPQYDKKLSPDQKSNWISSNLYYACKTSDKYVWFYNSKLDWWRKQNKNLDNIIRRVKRRLQDDFSKKGNIISGNSSTLDFINNVPESSGSFYFTYNKKNKYLSVKFTNKDSVDFFVFENSKLLLESNNVSGALSQSVTRFSGKGNLILAAKNKTGIYSFAFVN